MTAADDIHKYIVLFFKKIRLVISCESSASMNDQALISSKDKSKKINKVPSAANFRVNIQNTIMITAVSFKSLPLVFKCFFFFL